jgi:hypothetical protein
MIQCHEFSVNLTSSQHIILKVNQAEERQRDMSQQAGAGQGAGRSGGCRPRYILKGGRMDLTTGTKPYKSALSEIAQDTFNTGHNKFAAQFKQLQKNIANYLQHTSVAKGYLVAQTVRTGKQQTINLPLPVDPNAPDKADLEIIRAEEVKLVAKR